MLTIQKDIEYNMGATLMVEALKSSGVTKIFGYPGASVLSLYNELADKEEEITHCLCRHEQACVHAAEGYARVSGKVGVVLVTSGPGATNTITGIADAFADCTPLLVIAGASNDSEGKVFQNIDFKSMVSSVSKKFYAPKLGENLFEIVLDAINIANSGKKGPVVLQVTREILEQQFDFKSKFSGVKTSVNKNADLNNLVSLLEYAKAPLILVGGGCRESFDLISNFASKNKINVVSTLMGIGNIESACPYYKGMIGVNGVFEANEALFKSDLILAFGVAFSDRTTCKSEKFANGIPVVNINFEEYLLSNVNIQLQISADCKDVLEKLLKFDLTTKGAIEKADTLLEAVATYKMATKDVLECINEFTRAFSPIIITDVGQHQMLAAQCFDFSKPKRFLTSGGLGTMGFGLPAACGAHFAEPETSIINITGDGSFQMNIQELATVREYQIPVKIFVMNNGYLGMIRQTQEKLYGGKYYQSKMNNPDFITLAKGYDIQGYRVTSVEQLNSVLPKIFNNTLPIIVDCVTNEYENV